MSKNTRTFFVLLCMLAMVFVAACGGGSKEPNNNVTPGKTPDTTQPKDGGETKEPARGPIDITIMVPQHTPEIPDEKIKK